MRVTLSILFIIQGTVHFLGFLKAFGFIELNVISQPISKIFGLLWLIAFLLFALTLILFLNYSRYWWIFSIFAVTLSQFLIINYWADSKLGTILNFLILIAVFIAFSSLSFQKKMTTEINNLFTGSKNSEKSIITEQMLKDLPNPVKKWLCASGIPGKEKIQHIYLEQEIEMLMKQQQKNWIKAEARQYFSAEPPAFNWLVNLYFKPGLKIVGRDKFEDGKGEMLIKLLATIPVVHSKESKKINQATLQRYLAEIIWFPSAATSPYITWESIDNQTAKGTMNFKGTQGSGIFYFDEKGDFKKFVAMRYKDARDTRPSKWIVTAKETGLRNSIRIPVKCEVAWELNDKNWTWLKLKIADIKYNLQSSICNRE